MKSALSDQVYAGLLTILNNPKYFWYSPAGASYSQFTEAGVQELHKFMSMVAPHMVKLQEEELRALAKEIVIEELKR